VIKVNVEIIDTDFADDIALLPNYPEKPQNFICEEKWIMLQKLLKVYISGWIIAVDKSKELENFRYLGWWNIAFIKYMDTRIGIAWTASNWMNIIRKSNISKSLKISVWFGVTKALEKRLDRNDNDEARIAIWSN